MATKGKENKKDTISPEVPVVESSSEIVSEAPSVVEETEVPVKTAVDKINDFLFNKVRFLTRKPPAKLTRTAEDMAERKAAAQSKRERKNAKRLQNRG